jgi:hypothetical protein
MAASVVARKTRPAILLEDEPGLDVTVKIIGVEHIERAAEVRTWIDRRAPKEGQRQSRREGPASYPG